MTPEMSRQINLVIAERERRDAKWGEQNHPDLYWLGTLMEEVGEVARTVIEAGPVWNKERNKGIVRVAAVAVAWLEDIARDLARGR